MSDGASQVCFPVIEGLRPGQYEIKVQATYDGTRIYYDSPSMLPAENPTPTRGTWGISTIQLGLEIALLGLAIWGILGRRRKSAYDLTRERLEAETSEEDEDLE